MAVAELWTLGVSTPMQDTNSKRPRWPIPLRVAWVVGLLNVMGGWLISYCSSPTEDALHTVRIKGRGFTAFLTPEQYFWYHNLYLYGEVIIFLSFLVSIAYIFVLYKRQQHNEKDA